MTGRMQNDAAECNELPFEDHATPSSEAAIKSKHQYDTLKNTTSTINQLDRDKNVTKVFDFKCRISGSIGYLLHTPILNCETGVGVQLFKTEEEQPILISISVIHRDNQIM